MVYFLKPGAGARQDRLPVCLLRRLQERFSKEFGEEGMRWVLILDEAHDFRPEVLSMLRILTNGQ